MIPIDIRPNPCVTQAPHGSLTHSLTGPLDQRWVVALSWCCDHQPSLRQHLQRAQHRFPAGGSRFVRDDLEHVSMLVCHQVGDWHWSWQPDGVLHALGLIPADDVHDWILRFACLGFCCGCFVAESGSLLTHLAQSRTSIFQESVVSKTSGRTPASVRLTLLGSRFLHHTGSVCRISLLCIMWFQSLSWTR